MNTCECWTAALVAILLLPNVAASADAATEAYQKGLSCLGEQDYDAAIAAFTEAIRLNPKSAQAYYNRGKSYALMGGLENAIADCSEAVRLDPKLAVAYQCRGFVSPRKGENIKAEEDFTRAKKLGYKVVGPSGTEYQIEILVTWDHRPNGDVRVLGSIDDGTLRGAFKPVCSDLLVGPDSQER